MYPETQNLPLQSLLDKYHWKGAKKFKIRMATSCVLRSYPDLSPVQDVLGYVHFLHTDLGHLRTKFLRRIFGPTN